MAENAPFLPGLSPVGGKPRHVAFDAGRLTSDAGVLVLAEMIRFRALMIAAGYPDANDCEALRTDPAFKLAVGRLSESGAELCSQPTMCRLENLPKATALKRMMAAMVDLDRLHRSSLRQLRAGATADRARHRRYRGSGPRPAAAVFVPCP